MTGAGAFPWGPWFAHAVGRLRMRPQDFWRLSVVEWRALLRAPTQSLTREELTRLMQEYPDVSH